jgi:SAM-dependent methyltransferase
VYFAALDILAGLDRGADYSTAQLQWILAAWVLTDPFGRKKEISPTDGRVSAAYDKRSIYSIMYAIYRALGEVKSDTGTRYEATFNTWGYAWPEKWGPCPTAADDPQRFGKNAYTGLYRSAPVRARIEERGGRVHVVELGCGTGAGAHHVCTKVLPLATYQAVDMQRAAIQTCQRKFVPELGGRLVATWADATQLAIADQTADFVAVNETHVTDTPGTVTDEDQRFFRTAQRILKPGGFLVWVTRFLTPPGSRAWPSSTRSA